MGRIEKNIGSPFSSSWGRKTMHGYFFSLLQLVVIRMGNLVLSKQEYELHILMKKIEAKYTPDASLLLCNLLYGDIQRAFPRSQHRLALISSILPHRCVLFYKACITNGLSFKLNLEK